MTIPPRKRILAMLAKAVREAQDRREVVQQLWDDIDISSNSERLDAVWQAKELAERVYVAALELYVRASQACESGDIRAQLEVMADIRRCVPVGGAVFTVEAG